MSLRASKEIVLRGLAEASIEQAYAAQNSYPATIALYRSADFRKGPPAFAQKRAPIEGALTRRLIDRRHRRQP